VNCIRRLNFYPRSFKDICLNLLQKKVVESERQRMRKRIRSHLANDVWEHRDEPPKNWSQELPPNICSQYENSFLEDKAKKLKSGEETLSTPLDTITEESSWSCSIV